MPFAAPSSDLNVICDNAASRPREVKHRLVVSPLTVVELPYDCWGSPRNMYSRGDLDIFAITVMPTP